MNGELALLCALAAHGAVFLADDDRASAPELFPDATVCRWVNALEFHCVERRPGARADEMPVCTTCGDWYSGLRRRGATSVHLVRAESVPTNRDLPPHVEAGFSGGLDTAIVVHFANGVRELWTGQWSVTQAKHPEQRIWCVRFTGAAVDVPVREGPNVSQATVQLSAALDAAAELVRARRYFEGWEERFLDARRALDTPNATIAYHPDMLPVRGYSDAARRLMAAVSRGWVFGGMGSWNDVSVTDVARYRVVTDALFESVMDAAVAATNEPVQREHSAER